MHDLSFILRTKATNDDVLPALQERMTMQTAVDGATLLQQQAERYPQIPLNDAPVERSPVDL